MDLIVDFPQQDSPSGGGRRYVERVTFANYSEAIDVENLSYNYKTDLWFSRQEMHDFKYQNALVLGSISSAGMSMAQYAMMNVEQTELFLGLENHLARDAIRNIAARRKAICEAVIQEQARQAELGIYDPARLSIVSESLSKVAMQRSIIIGLIHAS